MRMILTLDEDVAAILERLRKRRDVSLEQLVSEALRRGLKEMTAPAKPREEFRTRSVDLGRLRIPGIDNIGEVLDAVEGDNSK
jgi:hypothetical protein